MWLRRRVLGPLLRLLEAGASPEKLAWSLAVGAVCGINPLLGSTTVLCLLLTVPTRLNLAAAQLANHVVYPLELALFFVFIRLGTLLFATGRLPLRRGAMLAALRHDPWGTTRLLWTWEWHAFVVWLLCSLALAPVLAFALMPVMRRLARRPAPAASA